MRQNSIFICLIACIVLTTIIGCSITNQTSSTSKKDRVKQTHITQIREKEEESKIPLRDRIDLAWAQERKMTQDPALGFVPKERIIPAWNYTKTKMAVELSTEAAISGTNWIELGPKNCGGRSRAVLVDANDVTGKTVFVGSVGGGLWKTTDITQTEPNWQVVNDFFGNIAITSIAQDPTNNQIMYFSTGEGYGNIDAIRGLGVWKSTNGGSSWTQLAATNNSTFYYCQKVLVSSTGVLFVATSSGLQRSSNGGTSFTKVLGTGLGITGATSDFSYDVEEAANGHIYACIAGTLHKSTNGGVSFGSSLPIGITASRIEIATAPNDANYVYVLCESGNVVSGIALSNNAGTSFTAKTEPADADPGIPTTDFSNGQGWYNLTIVVDPNNKDVIFVGGIDLFKSSNGGNTWQQASHWYGGFGIQNVHADQHNIIFSPGSSDIAYFVNDGGIYRTTNATASIPTITVKEINYNTTQFYAAAMSPTALSFDFLAGTQDNGSHKFSQSTIQNTTEVTGGDGAFCHIDQNQPQFWFSSYVFNDFFRSNNGGSSFTNITANGNGMFISPTDYDDIANIMYCSNTSNTYLRWNDPQTGSSFTSIAVAAFNGQVSAVKVSPNTSNRVFFGTDGGRVVRVDDAHGATPSATNISTGLPSAYVSCVEVETGNDNHILVTYSNYGVTSIWETTNGGTSWTQVEGNLPDMPIRWALFNPNNNDQAIIATELGVWSTDNLNGISTNWDASNTGLANVRVDMLQVRSSDNLVIAATHGRGLFYSDVFTTPTANFSADKLVTYQGVNINFDSKASYKATSWNWNFGDGTSSTLQNPTKTYTTSGKFNVTLTINSGASTLTKNTYIQVLPNRGTPYVVATDGGTFETNTNDFGSQAIRGGIDKWERGVPSNFLTTVNSPTNVWKTDLDADLTEGDYACVLMTPSYNFSSSASAYTLRFRRSMEITFCNAPFAVQCQYSTDKGVTWTRLGVNADPAATNWYNRGPATGCPIDASIFDDRYGWTVTSNNTLCTYNITTGVPALVGQPSVCFRFVLSVKPGYSASGYAVDGFMIDDFEILGPTNVASPTWNGTDWSGGTPTSTTDAIIASSIVPTASFSCQNLTINSGVALTTTGITATVNGNIVNNGNGIEGTGGLTIAANSTISGNAISFNGTLTVNSGATLTTGGLLTLTSHATNTARVANSAGNISGNVNVQRYFANKRAWRFVTAPAFNATTVNLSAGWQTQTHIVGPSGTGLDAIKPGYSFMTYAANTWTGVNNTTTTSQMHGANGTGAKAFAAFLLGDRSVNINSLVASSALTLSSTGSLLTGTQTINVGTLNTGNYFFVANPYASPVDLNQVFLNAGTTNINRTFYTWDPTLSGTGGYVTISWNGSSYDITPTSAQTQHVQSGQAFFVQATNSATTNIVFEENDKSTSTISNVFGVGNGNMDKLNISLQKIENSSLATIDGVLASFGAPFSKQVLMNEDAEKLFNNEEGITIRRNNTSLSIERRPFITNTNDTIFLALNRLVPNTNYTLNLNAQGWDAGMQAFLVDKMLSTETAINLQAATQDLSITSTVADAADRFMIVFRGTGNLPNNKLSLVATKRDKDVQLNWNIANEQGVKEYELQRSLDGTNFQTINNQLASNKGEYNNLDTKANNGINYYRVKMTMLNDDTRYSNIITINLQHLTSNIFTINPNPIKGNIAQIHLNDLAAGDYTIKLIDINGKIIQTQAIKHQGGTASRSLSLTNVAVGTYQLVLEGKGISKTISLVKGN